MSSLEIQNWEQRFLLVCKPEQSGKTFIMIQQIIKELNDSTSLIPTVNIILCDNNLLLTKQTSDRVENDLQEYEINGQIYVEFSSHKRAGCKSSDAACGLIATKGVRNIICCTNNKRIYDIYSIIEAFQSSEQKDRYKFKIWLDEADKFTNYIDSTLRPITNKHNNVEVVCITATPNELFRKYINMSVLPIKDTTSEHYHGWEDNIIKIYDIQYSTDIEFITHILEKVVDKNIYKPGTKWFIPGGFTKKSHTAVKDVCIRNGFAVFVVNGDGITLYMPYTFEKITIDKTDELTTLLLNMYITHKLERYPITITGNLCIGRGISISRNNFMLTHAILSNINNKQEASQISGRMKGNMKNWPNYKVSVVYTTEKFNKNSIEWETKSRRLAELAYEKGGERPVISKNEFGTLDKNYSYVIVPEYFKSYSKAIEYLNNIERKVHMCVKKNIPSGRKNSSNKNFDEYYVNTRILRGKSNVKDLTADDRLTKEEANKIAAGYNISSKTGNRYLIVPVYESMNSIPNSVEYQVRYIKFENDKL